MEPDGLKLEHKGRFTEEFGNYVVQADRYQNELGEIGWHSISWPKIGNPIHDYWVWKGKFHSVTMHQFENFTNASRITIDEIVEPQNADEKEAILEAIATWEKKLSPL